VPYRDGREQLVAKGGWQLEREEHRTGMEEASWLLRGVGSWRRKSTELGWKRAMHRLRSSSIPTAELLAEAATPAVLAAFEATLWLPSVDELGLHRGKLVRE
jgi:hypothetical protein